MLEWKILRNLNTPEKKTVVIWDGQRIEVAYLIDGKLFREDKKSSQWMTRHNQIT